MPYYHSREESSICGSTNFRGSPVSLQSSGPRWDEQHNWDTLERGFPRWDFTYLLPESKIRTREG